MFSMVVMAAHSSNKRIFKAEISITRCRRGSIENCQVTDLAFAQWLIRATREVYDSVVLLCSPMALLIIRVYSFAPGTYCKLGVVVGSSSMTSRAPLERGELVPIEQAVVYATVQALKNILHGSAI
jgi:hypothetical protein